MITVECNYCGKELEKYPSEIRSKNVYCDRTCLNNFRKLNHETRKCYNCDKFVTKHKSRFTGKKFFCTKECKDQWQKEGLKGENNPFYSKQHSKESLSKMRISLKGVRKKGKDNPRYRRVSVQCETCGKDTKKIPYLIQRNRFQYCSDECRHIGQSEVISGKENPNYNPNLTALERERNRVKELGYVKFKNDVLRRDNYQCILCKNTSDLVVHHLNSHHWDKENRTNPDNGVVLCSDCHSDFHKIYGYRNNTIKQFELYQASL